MFKYFKSLIIAGALVATVLGFTPITNNVWAVEVAYAQGQEPDCNDGTFITTGKRDCTLAERIADEDGFVYTSWKVLRNLINVILILGLLLISFSNITRISIDTYTVKKALPNLLIGVVMANASLFIIRYMADIATVATYFFVEQAKFETLREFIAFTISLIGIQTIQTLGATAAAVSAITALVLILILIIALIGTLWLAFILYIRLVAIYLLAILSPVAFIAYGIPGMDKYFRMWWQQFIKWLFILPAMSAIFWLMIVIGSDGNGHIASNISIAMAILLYVLFFFAVSLPSKMGGAMVDKATSAFKKAGVASQNLGYDATLSGKGMAKKGFDEKGAKIKGFKASMNRGFGGALQGFGVISTPTTIQRGMERRWKGKEKGREFISKQSKVYKKFAGKEARFVDAMEKNFEDLNGMSADDLAGELKELKDKDGGALQKWFDSLDDKKRHAFLTTPFNSWKTASENTPPGDLEDAAKFAAILKRYNMESRRRTQRVGGADALRGAGWDHEKVKQEQAKTSTAPYGYAGGLTPGHLAEITEGLKKGLTPDELAQTIGVKYSLDPTQVGAAARDLEADIQLQPHLDHFAGNFGPAASKEIAEAGAQLDEEFDRILSARGNVSFDTVISKGQEFMKKSGYFGAQDLSGKAPADQAAEMQRKVKLISQGAHAVANGQTASAANQLTNSINAMGSQLEQVVSANTTPGQQASFINSNDQVNQIITNNVTQQSQILNKKLTPEEIGSISQTIKNNLITGLTDKSNLKKIYGEKFQQTLKNAVISSGLGDSFSASQQPNPTEQQESQPSQTPPPQEPPTADESQPPPPSPQQ